MEPIYLLGACAVLIVMWFGIWLVFIGASQADDANEDAARKIRRKHDADILHGTIEAHKAEWKWAARLEDAAPTFDDDLGMMEESE
jgi:hypothetical protein